MPAMTIVCDRCHARVRVMASNPGFWHTVCIVSDGARMKVTPGSRIGFLLSLILATAAAGAADEATCRDISFPRHLLVNGSDLTLNGLGVRKATFLKVNVYVAAYYVAQPA